MRPSTIAALALALAAGSPADAAASSGIPLGQYGWRISDSLTDAQSNEGPFVAGLQSLYLWYACNVDDGMAAAEFDLVSENPANVILAFTPFSGFLNAGSATSLLLAVGGCPEAQPNGPPILAGSILVLQNAPGTFGLAPSGTSSNKVTVDCAVNPQAWPIQWVGYNHAGEPPLSKGWIGCEIPTHHCPVLICEPKTGNCSLILCYCGPDAPGCGNVVDDCSECEPTAVEAESWGRTKGRYR